mgnify:CR=1 FL=1
MYALNLFYENLQSAGTGSISFGGGRRWVRKWTVLPPGRKSHRLLQAIAFHELDGRLEITTDGPVFLIASRANKDNDPITIRAF